MNIAIDLVADRQVVFLDEPDAGLSPEFKVEVFESLQQLAHQNMRCVVAIIHDISNIHLFDQVIIMGKIQDIGRLLFYGPPADATTYFEVNDFSEIYDAISSHPERYVHE